MPHALNAAASSARTAPSAARHSFVGATSGAGSTYCVRPVREAPWTNAPGGAEPARCDTTQRPSWRKKPPSFSAAFRPPSKASFLLDSTACLARLALSRAAPRSGKATPERIVPSSVSSSAKRIGWQSSLARYASSSANARAEPATMLDKAAASAPSRRLLESQA